MLNALKHAQDSLESKNVMVATASTTNPGVPPSSLMAFLRKVSDSNLKSFVFFIHGLISNLHQLVWYVVDYPIESNQIILDCCCIHVKEAWENSWPCCIPTNSGDKFDLLLFICNIARGLWTLGFHKFLLYEFPMQCGQTYSWDVHLESEGTGAVEHSHKLLSSWTICDLANSNWIIVNLCCNGILRRHFSTWHCGVARELVFKFLVTWDSWVIPKYLPELLVIGRGFLVSYKFEGFEPVVVIMPYNGAFG